MEGLGIEIHRNPITYCVGCCSIDEGMLPTMHELLETCLRVFIYVSCTVYAVWAVLSWGFRV